MTGTRFCSVVLSLLSLCWSFPAQARSKPSGPERMLILQARLSPRGDRLALVGLRPAAKGHPAFSQLLLASSSGSQIRPASAPPFNVWSPTWLPDGKEILFLSDRLGTPQLFLFAPESQAEPIPLTSQAGGVSRYLPSPSGKHVAFLCPAPQRNRPKVPEPWFVVPGEGPFSGGQGLCLVTLSKGGHPGGKRQFPIQFLPAGHGPPDLGVPATPFAWVQMGRGEVLVAARPEATGQTTLLAAYPENSPWPPPGTLLPFWVESLMPTQRQTLSVWGHATDGTAVFAQLNYETSHPDTQKVPTPATTTGWPITAVAPTTSPWIWVGFDTLDVWVQGRWQRLPVPKQAIYLADVSLYPTGDALLATFFLADGSSQVGRIRLKNPVFQELASGRPFGAAASEGPDGATMVRTHLANQPHEDARNPCLPLLGFSKDSILPATLLLAALSDMGQPMRVVGNPSSQKSRTNTAHGTRCSLPGRIWVGTTPPPVPREETNSSDPEGPLLWVTWQPEQGGAGPVGCPAHVEMCLQAPMGTFAVPEPSALRNLVKWFKEGGWLGLSAPPP